MITFTVPANIQSIAIREYLRREVGLSVTNWRKIKHSGMLLLNGQPVPIHTLVNPGDIISVPSPHNCILPAISIPLNIVYEDDYLIVINKPAGMLVHPTSKGDSNTLANAIMFHYQSGNKSHGFHPIHRLDRNTSGLILIAKLAFIQHQLSQNSIKAVERRYQAIAQGTFLHISGRIDAPIARHPDSIIERIVHSAGQTAITSYQVLEQLSSAALLEIELFTGRTHQIRVHMSYIGHPLLGDDLYGGTREHFQRQALHASHIRFKHPISGATLEFTAPLPEDMRDLLIHLRT